MLASSAPGVASLASLMFDTVECVLPSRDLDLAFRLPFVAGLVVLVTSARSAMVVGI